MVVLRNSQRPHPFYPHGWRREMLHASLARGTDIDGQGHARETRVGLLIRTCTIASALGLVVVIIAIAISISNRSLQQQVVQQQQTINQGLTLSQINLRLVNSLALLATRDNDEKARQVLAEHGVKLGSQQTNPNLSQPPTTSK